MRYHLSGLSERSGISARRFRYCVEYDLLPEPRLEVALNEKGRPLRFGGEVAFDFLCAAWLVDLGLPHEKIREFLAVLGRVPFRRHGLIAGPDPSRGVHRRAVDEIRERPVEEARARFAPGVTVRVEIGGEEPWDSGWVTKVATLPPAGYRPNYEVVLDLAEAALIVNAAGRR